MKKRLPGSCFCCSVALAAATAATGATTTISTTGARGRADRRHKHNRPRSLVVGGSPTAPTRHPYAAALLAANHRPFCAGVLVAPDAVLSAAHCADGKGNQLEAVSVGRWTRPVPTYAEEEGEEGEEGEEEVDLLQKWDLLNKDNDDDNDDEMDLFNNEMEMEPDPAAEYFGISRVVHHPYHSTGFDYINDHLVHDVVLIRLNGTSSHSPIKMNFDDDLPRWDDGRGDSAKNVFYPVATNREGDDGDDYDDNDDAHSNRYAGGGDELTVMGWGSINSQRDKPTVLHSTTVHYVPNDLCSASTGDLNGRPKSYADYITPDMLCAAGSPGSGRDSCGGDSGGPLVRSDPDAPDDPRRDLLVGVVSWGYGCAHPDFPGVYARISAHRDWILAELCGDKTLGPRRYPQFCARWELEGPIPTLPPTPVPPTSAPTLRAKCLTVRIRFDDYPAEVGWSLQPVAGDGSSSQREEEGDLEEEDEVITRVPGYYRDAGRGQAVHETVCLPATSAAAATRKYSFAIVDKVGDGMMAGRQEGSYEVLDADDGTVLAQGGGNFQLVRVETMEIGLASDDAAAAGGGPGDGVGGEEVRPGEDRSGAAHRSGGMLRPMLALSIAMSAMALVSVSPLL